LVLFGTGRGKPYPRDGALRAPLEQYLDAG
jgi:hypothetical protein